MNDNFVPENIVVNILRKEYTNWIKSLSKDEYMAIRKYSYNSYDREKPFRLFERINGFFRGTYNGNDNDILIKYGELISSALNKANTQNAIICYRGTNHMPTTERGKIISFDQFLSTSVISSRCFRGKYNLIIYVPKGIHGAYIEQISHYPKQREFLLDKKCKYEIISSMGSTINLKVLMESEVEKW